MRIVYVISQYPTLSETFIAREIEQLVEQGHEIIICPLRPPLKKKGPSGLEVSGTRILRSPLAPLAWASAQAWLLQHNFAVWWACWRDILRNAYTVSRLHHLIYILAVTTWLARCLQESAVDHIRVHFLRSEAVSCMWLSRMLGVSYSLTVHTKIIEFPFVLILKALRGAAFLIGDIQEVRNLLDNLGLENIYLIRNGLNLKDLPFRGVNFPSPDPPLILAVGRLVNKKGFDVLIRACARLNSQGIPFICRIIGDGEQRTDLERMIRELGLENLIQMPGSLPFTQLKEEYARATIFVMPSKGIPKSSDGLPTVLIESMALGVPVIATRMAGIPDLVKHGETGLLAEPNDPVSLFQCMLKLLTDPDLKNIFSVVGREKVEKEFNIQQSVSTLLNLLNFHSGISPSKKKVGYEFIDGFNCQSGCTIE